MSLSPSKSLSLISYFLLLLPQASTVCSLDGDIQASLLTHVSFSLCPVLATQAVPFYILNPPFPHCHFLGLPSLSLSLLDLLGGLLTLHSPILHPSHERGIFRECKSDPVTGLGSSSPSG